MEMMKIYRDSEERYDDIEYSVELTNYRKWDIPGDWEQPRDSGFEFDYRILDSAGKDVTKEIKLSDHEYDTLTEKISDHIYC